MRKYLWLLIVAGAVRGLESDVRSQEKAVTKADITKEVRIEKPTNTILAQQSGNIADHGKYFVNPKVQPGSVLWHPTLAAACEAARKSGKPVLLFQMMGKLDDQFC